MNAAIPALLGIIFLAAVVRGYSGFGFSALVLLGGGLLLAPHELVPVLYLLEIAASLWLLHSARDNIDWRLLAPLLIGAAVASPLGLSWLAQADSERLMNAVSLAIGGCCLLLWRGHPAAVEGEPRGPTGALASLGIGALAGLVNGFGGVGGLVVAVYLLATRQPPPRVRGSMAALLLILGLYGLLGGLYFGLFDRHSWQLAALGLPALALGMLLGGRLFTRSDPARFRRALLLLLIALSLLHPLQQLSWGQALSARLSAQLSVPDVAPAAATRALRSAPAGAAQRSPAWWK